MASRCGLCGFGSQKLLLDMGVQPLAESLGDTGRYPLRLGQCFSCGLTQLMDDLPPEVVFRPDHPYATGNTRALREHFARLARDLAIGMAPSDLTVDIGANDGTLLRAYPPAYRTVGVEPTGQAVKCPPPVYREFFTSGLAERIRSEHGAAKVVTACNVLAHVRSPGDFASGVAHLLDGDGVFVTENHDLGSVTRGLQVDTIYHEHRWYWSVATLSRLLAEHGLYTVSAVPVATHGGSFRLTARKGTSAAAFADRAENARGSLRLLLATLNGPVFGIGATTRATPLIHWARIDEHLTCVCEVPGSEKIGTMIPGTAIPVVPEDRLIAEQPPYALLLAWHLRDSIVPALRAKGYKGRFIVPLPAAEVIDG